MEQKRLRWGLLSTARINSALIPAIRKSSRSELLAIASRDREKAKTYAQEWNIPRAHTSYEPLLADPEIDVIFNPLPNGLHGDWTVKAAERGKHVLCEKPLEVSEDKVREIVAASKKNKVAVAEAFMYRHHPQIKMVQDWIKQGEIGELEWVLSSFTFTLSRPDDPRWKPELGGGAVWDVGCYPINFARTVIGKEPEEIFGWQKLTLSGVDLSFWGIMRFPGGVVAQIDCGFGAPLRKRAEVVGSKGTIILEDPWHALPGANIILRRGKETKRIPVPEGNSYFLEVEQFCDVILEGKQPLVTLEDSLNNVRAISALYQSAHLGKPVKLGKA